MNKKHQEILAKIRESVIESQTIKYDFGYNRDCRKYSEDVLKTINSKLKEVDFPIVVEEPDGRRVLLTDPRLVYNPEKDKINTISFSLFGKPITSSSVEIKIENSDIKF